MTDTTRPTKKQHETLGFIRSFIEDNGFSPSYREIMRGCNYTSVATVSLHVNNLINRGHLVKRGKSARSLELAKDLPETKTPKSTKKQPHGHELIVQIEKRFRSLEKRFEQTVLDEVYVLVGALKVMGYVDPALQYCQEINSIRTEYNQLD